jgi:protein-S-isoprenylcysteine O-methyltransferase Ste14
MNERMAFLFGRALPLAVFGFLVAIQGELAVGGVQRALLGDLDRAQSMYLINRILTLAFFTFLLGIYAVRSRAIASDHNPLAVIAALVGSFILYGLWLVPGPDRSTDIWVLTASDMLLACGMIWAIYSLSYLRNRFSIVPEARGLVVSGPYELVRHPIYLGEITAGLGLVLPTLLSLHMVIFAVFLGAQVGRTYYEERILRRSYPEYAEYSRHTHRLLPFLF